MKRISSRLAFLILAVALVFPSCEKPIEPEIDETQKNQATYDGVTYSYTQAFQENLGGYYQRLRFASEDITWDQESYSYSGSGNYLILSFVLERFVSTFSDGNYTFNLDEEDNSVNGIQLRCDATDITLYNDSETTGSATIVKTDDIYEVTGTFIIAGKELKVYYKGTLSFADLFNPGK